MLKTYKSDIYSVIPLHVIIDLIVYSFNNGVSIKNIDHWLRVLYYLIYLCEEKSLKMSVPICYAFIHDSRLSKDNLDTHGEDASKAIFFIKNHLNLSKKDLDLLMVACKYHNHKDLVDIQDKLILMCWDIDNYDYEKRGLECDSNYLFLQPEDIEKLSHFHINYLEKYVSEIKRDIIKQLKFRNSLLINLI